MLGTGAELVRERVEVYTISWHSRKVPYVLQASLYRLDGFLNLICLIQLQPATSMLVGTSRLAIMSGPLVSGSIDEERVAR